LVWVKLEATGSQKGTSECLKRNTTTLKIIDRFLIPIFFFVFCEWKFNGTETAKQEGKGII